MTKADLRRELRARLKGVSAQDRQAWSALAAERLQATPEYVRAATVMLFLSLPSEIDTRPLIEHARSAGKRVAVPRTRSEDRSMEAVLLAPVGQLMRQTSIGVVEPDDGEVLRPEDLDLLLVPALGYGPAGERLGRGAGFYDRFLARPQLAAITCGYGFEIQLLPGIPMEPADVHLQMLVTNEKVRHFRVK